mgnify:CR=1 FL=1
MATVRVVCDDAVAIAAAWAISVSTRSRPLREPGPGSLGPGLARTNT